MSKTEIAADEYFALRAKHTRLADTTYKFAAAQHVYERDGLVCRQTYSHRDHRLTSVEVATRNGAPVAYFKMGV